jgi:hypothetical protein
MKSVKVPYYEPATESCAGCEGKITCKGCGRDLCSAKDGKCVTEAHYTPPNGPYCMDCNPAKKVPKPA